MNLQHFQDKEKSLQNALLRVKKKLENLKNNWQNMPTNEVEKWNNWHDLEYRLQNRLKENYLNYQNWHFQKYDFVAL